MSEKWDAEPGERLKTINYVHGVQPSEINIYQQFTVRTGTQDKKFCPQQQHHNFTTGFKQFGIFYLMYNELGGLFVLKMEWLCNLQKTIFEFKCTSVRLFVGFYSIPE